MGACPGHYGIHIGLLSQDYKIITLTIAHSWPKSKRQRSEGQVVFTCLLVPAVGVKEVGIAEVLAVTSSGHHVEHDFCLKPQNLIMTNLMHNSCTMIIIYTTYLSMLSLVLITLECTMFIERKP